MSMTSLLETEKENVLNLVRKLGSGKLQPFDELLTALNYATKMLKIEDEVLSDALYALAEATGEKYPPLTSAATNILDDILAKYN